MKIYKLPQSDPKNFGPKRVRSKKYSELEKKGQLNLFNSGKILQLSSQTFFDQALHHDEEGDTETAKKLYLKSIEKEQNSADAFCNLGIIECEGENFPKGINYFSLCLLHNPRHYKAHFNLANTYSELGDLNLAKLHYQVCIEIEPSFSNAHFNLGLTLARNGEYEEAIQCMERFLLFSSAEEQATARVFISKLCLLIQEESPSSNG